MDSTVSGLVIALIIIIMNTRRVSFFVDTLLYENTECQELP